MKRGIIQKTEFLSNPSESSNLCSNSPIFHHQPYVKFWDKTNLSSDCFFFSYTGRATFTFIYYESMLLQMRKCKNLKWQAARSQSKPEKAGRKKQGGGKKEETPSD